MTTKVHPPRHDPKQCQCRQCHPIVGHVNALPEEVPPPSPLDLIGAEYEGMAQRFEHEQIDVKATIRRD